MVNTLDMGQIFAPFSSAIFYLNLKEKELKSANQSNSGTFGAAQKRGPA